MLFYYIAGPMAGMVDHNIPLFDQVAKHIRAYGGVPVNPADHSRDLAQRAGMPVDEYRRQFSDRDWRVHIYKYDLRKLVTSDAIVLLEGWHESRGATLEALVAYQLGLDFYLWNNGLTHVTDTIAPLTHFIEQHYNAEAKAAGVTATVFTSVKVVEQESVCHEADRLVDGARQKDYGHPIDNYDRVAQLWTAYLRGKRYNFDTNDFDSIPDAKGVGASHPMSDWLAAEDVMLMMNLLKVGRLEHGYHRDSAVDMAGYAKCLDMIVTERKARG